MTAASADHRRQEDTAEPQAPAPVGIPHADARQKRNGITHGVEQPVIDQKSEMQRFEPPRQQSLQTEQGRQQSDESPVVAHGPLQTQQRRSQQHDDQKDAENPDIVDARLQPQQIRTHDFARGEPLHDPAFGEQPHDQKINGQKEVKRDQQPPEPFADERRIADDLPPGVREPRNEDHQGHVERTQLEQSRGRPDMGQKNHRDPDEPEQIDCRIAQDGRRRRQRSAAFHRIIRSHRSSIFRSACGIWDSRAPRATRRHTTTCAPRSQDVRQPRRVSRAGRRPG